MRLKGILFFAALMSMCQISAQELGIRVDNKGRVGFADENGNVVIKCQYESAQPFKNGVAIVTKSGKSGMIDVTGKVVLPLKYTQISKWTDNVYLIKSGKQMGLADASGRVLLDAKYSLITKPNCYGKALIATGGKLTTYDNKKYMANAKYGIVDASGNILVPATYKGLYEFSWDGSENLPYNEGKRLEYSYHYITDTLVTDCSYLGFSNNGFNIYKTGIIDGKGTVQMKAGLYEYVMQPKAGMVRYYNSNKKSTTCGYHNLETGKSMQVASFNKPIGALSVWTHGDFTCDMAPVNNGDTWSLIDKSGTVLRQGFTQIKRCEQFGLLAVKTSEGKWNVIDEANNDIQALSGYEEILFPDKNSEKEVYVAKKDGVYGAIDRNGTVLIPFEYAEACACSADFIALKKDDSWGLLTTDNRIVVPFEYTSLILPSETNTQHFWVKKSDSKFYHYSADSKKLSTTGFKSVINFKDGLAFVVPADLVVENTLLNRAQSFAPNTAQDIIAKSDISQYKALFGYLYRTDDVIVVGKPISTWYKDAIIKELAKNGNRKLTDMEIKNILLEVTRENRSYGLDAVIGESDWNY